MNRRLTRLLPWIIGLALVAWVLWQVSLEAILEVLARLHLWQIIVLIVANLAVLIFVTARWWIILVGLGYRLPFGRTLSYRLAAFGLSYFTPGPHLGGEPLQVVLVERQHGLPRSKSVAAVTIDKALEMVVNFSFLLIGIALILRWEFLSGDVGVIGLLATTALLALPIIYLILTHRGYRPFAGATNPLAHVSFLERWSGKLTAANRAIAASETQMGNFLQQSPGLLVLAIFFSLAGWAAMIAEYWLMVSFLGVRLTILELVVTLTAARIAILLLLPAGLGALEVSQTLAFGLLGLDPAVGAATSLLIRARDTLLGGLGLWLGGRLLAAPATTEELQGQNQP